MVHARCSVPECSNERKKLKNLDKNITFHVFPKDEKTRKKWLNFCKITKNYKPGMVICSIHFESECFKRDIKGELLNLRLRLNFGAAPTIYRALESTTQESKHSVRTKNRNYKNIVNDLLEEESNALQPVKEKYPSDFLDEPSNGLYPIKQNYPISDRNYNYVDKKFEINVKLQELQITCDYSGEIFENLVQLIKNRQKNNSLSQIFRCSDNSKRNRFTIKCFNCPLQFDSTVFIDGWTNIQKVMPGLKSNCDFCKKYLLTKRVFHHNCYLCNISIVSCRQLANHLKTVHNSSKPFSCIICGSIFHLFASLRIHIRKHTGETPYSCNICCAKFRYAQDLKTHQYTTHLEKKFECNICKNEYLTPTRLQRHLRLHEKKKTKEYKCDICEKKFAFPSYLKRHRYTHSEQKKFQCSICKNKFASPNGLREHVKSHKKRESKEYDCYLCGKEFAKSVHLKRHMYIHLGEKQFECSICKNKYSTPHGLSQHIKYMTKEKLRSKNMIVKRNLHNGII